MNDLGARQFVIWKLPLKSLLYSNKALSYSAMKG